MAKSRRVQVTELDIRNAERGNSSRCMVADAIKRELGVIRTSVDIQTIAFSSEEDGKRYRYLTPLAVQRALVDFDLGIPQKPFTFMLPTRPAFVTDIHRGGDRIGTAPKLQSRDPADTKARVVPTAKGGRDRTPAGALSNVSKTRAKRRMFGIRGLGGNP